MRSCRTFRGRRVNRSARYPRVYHPEHPAAMADGMVYVHRLVAWDAFGEIRPGWHVHHKNGDREDWRPENLELLPARDHSRRHRPRRKPVVRRCGACGTPLEIRTARRRALPRVYCSRACVARGREVVDWPSDEELLTEVDKTSARAVGRRLGVSNTAVSKRVRRIRRGSGRAGTS